ncbi:MAG: DUF3842 family protein [Clostridia bacterium]|nr:DUF3842 family protein [Clostridia bacterium]
MNIAVIDAQGAGLGKTIIKMIRKQIHYKVHITALGTNEYATQNMLDAGANLGVTGETQICSFCKDEKIDCIIGPIGILSSGGIKGEITPSISFSIFNMNCKKYIIPLKKHGIYIPGTRNLKIKEIMQEIVWDIKNNISP